MITFPKPTADDIDIDLLLPAVIADLTAERSLDSRWVEPLTGYERDVIAVHWRGGSVRQLRRIVEVVLRVRESTAVRQ